MKERISLYYTVTGFGDTKCLLAWDSSMRASLILKEDGRRYTTIEGKKEQLDGHVRLCVSSFDSSILEISASLLSVRVGTYLSLVVIRIVLFSCLLLFILG